ncbi:unnamed protein product [Sympodiomycopsis kandeliae]
MGSGSNTASTYVGGSLTDPLSFQSSRTSFRSSQQSPQIGRKLSLDSADLHTDAPLLVHGGKPLPSRTEAGMGKSNASSPRVPSRDDSDPRPGSKKSQAGSQDAATPRGESVDDASQQGTDLTDEARGDLFGATPDLTESMEQAQIMSATQVLLQYQPANRAKRLTTLEETHSDKEHDVTPPKSWQMTQERTTGGDKTGQTPLFTGATDDGLQDQSRADPSQRSAPSPGGDHFARLQGLHLADIQEKGYLVQDDSVYVTRNGCEAMCLPRPKIELSSHLDEHQRGLTGAVAKCWTAESLDDVYPSHGSYGAELRRATFERNRRPSHQSLAREARLQSSKSTPNLLSLGQAHAEEGDDHDSEYSGQQWVNVTKPLLTGKERSKKPARKLELLAPTDHLRGRSRSNSQPADPSPKVAAKFDSPSSQSQGTPALDKDRGTPSPSAQHWLPEVANAHGLPRLKVFDIDSHFDSFDRDDLLQDAVAFDLEREKWRADFDKSIDGRGRSKATKESSPDDHGRRLFRSRSRSRRAQGGKEGESTAAQPTDDGEGDEDGADEVESSSVWTSRKARELVLSGGPNLKRRSTKTDNKRLKAQEKSRVKGSDSGSGSGSGPHSTSGHGHWSSSGHGHPTAVRRRPLRPSLRFEDEEIAARQMALHSAMEEDASEEPGSHGPWMAGLGCFGPPGFVTSSQGTSRSPTPGRGGMLRGVLRSRLDPGPVMLPATSSEVDVSAIQSLPQTSRPGSGGSNVRRRKAPAVEDVDVGTQDNDRATAWRQPSSPLNPGRTSGHADSPQMRPRSWGTTGGTRVSPPHGPPPQCPLPAIPGESGDSSSMQESLLPEDVGTTIQRTIGDLSMYSDLTSDLMSSGGSIRADSMIEPRNLNNSNSNNNDFSGRGLTPRSSAHGSLKNA